MNNINHLLSIASNNKNCGLVYYQGTNRIFISYHELAKDVKKALSQFEELDIKKGDYLAIIGDNSYHWVVYDLACLFSGIVTVPLSTLNYKQNLDSLEKLSCKVIITNLKEFSAQKNVYSFDYYQKYPGEEISIDDGNLSETDPVSIVFTSGTTNTPKAIEIRKKAVESILDNGFKTYAISKNDKLIAFLPFSDFLQRMYIYGAIFLEIDIVIAHPTTIFSLIPKENPTVVIGIPYFFETVQNNFLTKIKTNRFGFLFFKSHSILYRLGIRFPFSIFKKIWGNKSRFLISGSAPLKLGTYDFYKKMGITIYQAYGMAESGMIAMNGPGNNKRGSVGKICNRMQVELIDEEVVVSSNYAINTTYRIGESETYKNGKVYTNDIGFIDDEGYLFLKGRKNNTIVLGNGNKIYPDEAENQICLLIPEIADCMIFTTNGNSLDLVISLLDKAKEQEVRTKIQQTKNSATIPKDITKIEFINEAFSPQNGYLTISLKKNRKK